MLLFSIL
jgi:hypothetical protein